MVDVDLEDRLRTLATRPDSEHPIISLYLDIRRDDRSRREKDRIWLKNRLREAGRLYDFGPGERDGFEADVARIHDLLDHGLEEGAEGLALFACQAEDLFEALQVPRPFANQLLVSTRPILRPLVEFLDEYEPVVVAVVDTRSARIYEIVVGGVVDEHAVENEVPGRIDVGGWHQMHYQRKVEEEMAHHHKEVADRLARVVDRGDFRRVILLGQPAILGSLKRHLPRRILERVIREDSLDRGDSKDRVLARTLELIGAHEPEAEEVTLDRLRERTLSGGLGVCGIEDTLEALRMGNVHALIVDGEFDALGYRCGQCSSLQSPAGRGEREPFRCRFCEGPLDRVELDEALLQAAIAQGAQVHTVERFDDELADLGHVGAFLRYRE